VSVLGIGVIAVLPVAFPEGLAGYPRAWGAAGVDVRGWDEPHLTGARSNEIDLVVVRDDGKVLAIEVKLASSIEDRDTKHLHWLAQRLGNTLLDAAVINTGPNAYRRPDGIGVIPLGLLAP